MVIIIFSFISVHCKVSSLVVYTHKEAHKILHILCTFWVINLSLKANLDEIMSSMWLHSNDVRVFHFPGSIIYNPGKYSLFMDIPVVTGYCQAVSLCQTFFQFLLLLWKSGFLAVNNRIFMTGLRREYQLKDFS